MSGRDEQEIVEVAEKGGISARSAASCSTRSG